MTTTFDPVLMENQFQTWYSDLAKSLGLPQDPDAPGNNYNYRAAWIYGQHTGQPIPGPDNQLPAYFNTNPAATPQPQGGGLPEIMSKISLPNLLGPSQAWAGPPPVQWAEPPNPQFSERFNQVATPPVAAPGSQPLTLEGKPVIGPPGGKWVLDEPAAPGQGGHYVDLSEIKLDSPAGGQWGVGQIVKDPDFLGLPQVEQQKVLATVDPDFAGLPPEEQTKVLSILGGGQSGFKVISPDMLDPISDPMAESLNMFDPAGGAKELAKQVGEHGQAVGTLATAATKLPGVVAAPITGLAVAAGGLLNRAQTGKDTPLTPEEQALMDQGLPFATGDMAKDFLTGVGAEFGGRGVAWAAGKLLAPAAGKITDTARSFMEFAKKNNLPYSPDAVAPSWRSKLFQSLADTGVGKYFTTRQRRELVQGASEAAGKVLDDLGLPAPLAPTEAAGDLAGYLRQLSNKKLTHAQFNEAMGRIPAEAEMAVPNLMQSLEDIGGLKSIHEMYVGKSGKAPREFGLLKRVINRDGVITKDEIDYFNKSIWRKYKDMDPEARAAAGKLKGGLLKDLDTVLDPELGQTLGAIRTAADEAYKQAESFLQSTPLAGAMLKAGRPEAKARQFFNLFSEGHQADALTIREHLLSTGNKDLWDTTKASYFEGVFKRATKLSDDTGETVFQPGAFINWFDKYGKGASEVMPEHAAALQEWYNVSKGLLKDYKRYGERGREGVVPSLKLGALTGGGYLAGGVPGIVVSNGFALLSALGTMGRGNLGFLRNYLLKESAPFGPGALKIGSELAGVEGYQPTQEPTGARPTSSGW